MLLTLDYIINPQQHILSKVPIWDRAPTVDFICKNEATLRLVRPSNFIEKVTQYQQNESYLDYLINQEAAVVIKKLQKKGW